MAITRNAARYASKRAGNHGGRVNVPNNLHPTHGPVIRRGIGHPPPPPHIHPRDTHVQHAYHNAPPPPPPMHQGGHPGQRMGFHNGHAEGQFQHAFRNYMHNRGPDLSGMIHDSGLRGGPHPGQHGNPQPLPNFGQGGQPGGWQGLQGIFQMLQGGGVNASQLANLGKGYTGGNGYAVGNAHDAFSGLSPYAAHWLATSGILQQAAPHLQDTTGLTGDALFSANMMNNLAQSQAGSGPYTLHSGITQDMLGQMLGMTQGGGYAQGYNAQGRLNPMNGQPFAQGGFVPPGPR